MSWNNKVVWSEGMFMRPQHFQQHARFIEQYVEGRSAGLRCYPWGFQHLELDQQLLALGKLSIAAARGVFPDGTPFNIPHDDDPPAPFEVTDAMKELRVFLTLPNRRPGTAEFERHGGSSALARYAVTEYEVRDTIAGTDSVVDIEVGRLRTKLLAQDGALKEYACLGVARIVEARADKNVILDADFIPPILDCQVSLPLAQFIRELQGMLHHRGEALAGRLAVSGRGGAAEIADFLLLQTVNRYQPLVAHLADLGGLHPESFYRLAVEMAGELSTFTTKDKRPVGFPPYRHDDLHASFAPVMAELRRSLSMVLEQTAISIPLELRKYGIRVARFPDKKLLSTADFVLAVSADMPTESLRKSFPREVKIGTVEQIRDLVNLALPGIRVAPLAVAPRQIPYHAGFVYFELDQKSEHWRGLQDSGGCAIHTGGKFPELTMELWAIRRG